MENQTTEVPTEGADSSNPAGLVLEPPPSLVKLDLGGGQNPREGFECVDLNAPNPAHRVDLFKFPWPFADDSVDELHASHFIEHIPNRDVEARDIAVTPERAAAGVLYNTDERDLIGKDMLFAFFDECWRILKHDGWLTLQWPALRSDRAFQDPTHRRYIPLATMPYMSRDWRKSQGLDHYRVKCHFGGDIGIVTDPKYQLLHPEAAEKPLQNYWNTIIDFTSKMKCIKPPVEPAK